MRDYGVHFAVLSCHAQSVAQEEAHTLTYTSQQKKRSMRFSTRARCVRLPGVPRAELVATISRCKAD